MSRQGWQPLGKWALLGVATSAAVMAMGSDEATVQPLEAHAPQVVAVPPAETAAPGRADDNREFEQLLQQKLQAASAVGADVGNAFNATSWYVPPPPPPPMPPPAPSAPPLPFTYLGLYREAGAAATIIILAKAELVYTVSSGDVIDGAYSIGALSGGVLEFTYLPLGIKQTLNVGAEL